MRFVVLDLEFTQPNRKILQIGAVTLDFQQAEIKPLFDEICNPGEMPNTFITELTGIAKEEVRKSRSLRECLISFWEIFGKAKVHNKLASWGSVDYEMIAMASEELGVEVPYMAAYNFKNMIRFYQSAMGKSARSGVGLQNIAKEFGLEFQGRPHNAFADAEMTAQVMLYVYQQMQKLNV